MASRRRSSGSKSAVQRRQVQHPIIPKVMRHKVQVLRRAGLSRAKVHAQAGVSVRSIRCIEKEAAVTSVEEHGASKARGVGRLRRRNS